MIRLLLEKLGLIVIVVTHVDEDVNVFAGAERDKGLVVDACTLLGVTLFEGVGTTVLGL